jgi:hypothetical protein
MSEQKASPKKIQQALKKLEEYEYLCPICNGQLIPTTGGMWCPLHGTMELDLIKVQKKVGLKRK